MLMKELDHFFQEVLLNAAQNVVVKIKPQKLE